MAHLTTYGSYKGYGDYAQADLHYSQSVRVGDIIEISGQGGWNNDDFKISADLTQEIEQAFNNVDLALKAIEGSGWDRVFKINCYAAPLDDDLLAAFVQVLKKWCPDHKPLVTGVGVAELALEGMRVEIEVRAHVPHENV